jgi:hypothetical protein
MEGRKMGVAVRVRREESSMPDLSISEIEGILGFDKIKPVTLTPSEEAQLEEEGEVFERLYEEDLRDYFFNRRGRS